MWFWLAASALIIAASCAVLTLVLFYTGNAVKWKCLVATLVFVVITVFVVYQKPAPPTMPQGLDESKHKNKGIDHVQPLFTGLTNLSGEQFGNGNTLTGQNEGDSRSPGTNQPENSARPAERPQPAPGTGGNRTSFDPARGDDAAAAAPKTTAPAPAGTPAPAPQAGDAAAFAPEPKRAEINNYVNFRSSAGIKSEIIKVLPPGTRVELLGPYHPSRWVKIKETKTGQKGWVYGNFITPLD